LVLSSEPAGRYRRALPPFLSTARNCFMPIAKPASTTPVRKYTALIDLLGALSLTPLHAADPEVPYPEGYRAWQHVRSAYIGPGPGHERFGGMHHIYANAKAMQGLRSGQFADGAVLVFDLLEVEPKGNTLIESRRRFVDVMTRDSVSFASTGGWGYAEFKGDSRTERTVGQHNALKECHECHTKQAARGFVFGTYRE
jgi:hypothetical protein